MDKEKILETFYDGMPDDLSLEKCAEGVYITSVYNGTPITINTAAGYKFRTKPIDFYYKILEERVIDTVKNELEKGAIND